MNKSSYIEKKSFLENDARYSIYNDKFPFSRKQMNYKFYLHKIHFRCVMDHINRAIDIVWGNLKCKCRCVVKVYC